MFFYNSFIIKQVWTYDMYFEVASQYKIGVNTRTDAIFFGKATPGAQSMRHLNLTNEYDYPVSVSIKIDGDIAPFISVSDNNFILQPGEKKHLTYYATTQQDTPDGNYTGETKAIIRRVLFS